MSNNEDLSLNDTNKSKKKELLEMPILLSLNQADGKNEIHT